MEVLVVTFPYICGQKNQITTSVHIHRLKSHMFRILAKHFNYKRLYVVYNALTVLFIFY